MHSLPTEILSNIFNYIPAKDLTKCREVCVRWSLIIDGLAGSDNLWSKHCKEDFSSIYAVARKKAKPGLLWYNLYRSLALWQRISLCREDTDEFLSASCLDEEIRNFEILGNGVLGVHKKTSIVYYDIDTLQESKRAAITGDYLRYTENDNVIVIQSYHLHCFLIRKALFDKYEEESNVTFDNVKLYALTEDALYFVNLDDEIFICSFDDKKLRPVFLKQSRDGIMSVGYRNGHLNILTFQREIFTIVGNDLVYKCSLGPDSNLLHQLQKFNFLEQLDWRVYFQWMYVLKHAIPDGPLRDIIIIRPYGDVYFVGTNWGVLQIYYAPYSAGELNIFNTQPVRQYNFTEHWGDWPVLSMCPILQVDVFEVEDGHTVLVAMPRKIAVLNFTHTFKQTASLAMLPYSEIQTVKCEDDSEITCHMHSLPTEILLIIFNYIPAKDLTKCREVCVRWSLIIDGLAGSDDLWSKHCKEDFSSIYTVARKKAKPGLLWYNLYRSLALWQRISLCREDTDEFLPASCYDEEIRNFEILGNGVLGVHKKTSIVYYDIDTLQESKRAAITGDYLRYTENDNVIVIQSYHLHCFLIRKALFDKYEEESNVTFDHVKLYALTEDALYFVNLDDEIFICSFDDKKLRPVFLKQSTDGIMSVGYRNGHLNILTFQREIFTIVGNDLVYKCSLGPDSNLLHQLQKFNFLEQLDWRVYFQWMYVLKHAIPDGPLRDIIIIRPYGDVYFVGSNWGVLRIYYAPYSAGELNIFNTQPVRQYNFMEHWRDWPVLSMCPILQVDVFEVEDGHTVLVAMPRKIAVLKLTHTDLQTDSFSCNAAIQRNPKS